MTKNEFLLLQTSDSKELIERYLNSDSLTAALKIGSPAISSQIKYLAKAASKLPHYFASRCIISEIGYEQSSSEVTAFSKFEALSGELAIDLTCGLGVDAFALSTKFRHIIAVEADELKAEIARYNFSLLGATNVEVVNCTAEDFIAKNQHLTPDLIYVDPSRVAAGKRVFSIEESTPNVALLMPILTKISQRIIIKLSPMFDVEECFRIFSNRAQVEAVSVKNECKEVLVKLGCGDENSILNTIISGGEITKYRFARDLKYEVQALDFEPQYVYIADVVFYKTRTLDCYLSATYGKCQVKNENYVFSAERLANFAGQSFSVEFILPYSPKKIKKILQQMGVKSATIHLRNFPYSIGQVMAQLSINQGGERHILLTNYNGAPTFILGV